MGRLRGAGAGDITVRLDKGFFSRDMVRTLDRLGVSFLLKVPRHGWLGRHRGPWRFSAKGEAVFPGEELWTATGMLWSARLLTVQTTRPMDGDGMLDLGAYKILRQADVLTNIGGIHALTAWRRYNKGAPWSSSGSRNWPSSRPAERPSTTPPATPCCGASPSWPTRRCTPCANTSSPAPGGTAQPKRLRLWLFRLPAKLTAHARKDYLQFPRGEPVRSRLLTALRGLNRAIPPPVPA